jgi:hypothetical protein
MLGKRCAFVPNRNYGGRVWGWVEAGCGSPAVLFLLVRFEVWVCRLRNVTGGFCSGWHFDMDTYATKVFLAQYLCPCWRMDDIMITGQDCKR